MFVDSVIVVGFNGETLPLMTLRKWINIQEASKDYQQIINAVWPVAETK